MIGIDWMFEYFYDEPEETVHSIFHREVTRWFADEGDLTLRMDYNLNHDSKVLDIGGFKGDFASDIYSKYLCNISVFEPIKSHSNFITGRFKLNPNIKVNDFAFGSSDRIDKITIAAEASSLYIDSDKYELITVKDFNEFMNGENVIDLAKINIEGGEYELLENISEDNIKKIKNIQVQFHTFISDCQARKHAIREKLSLTHDCTYCYEFVWENWKLK
jgi:FkbM family methyltransferase